MPESSPRETRKQEVLAAAQRYLSSAELSWERLLTYDKLEELTGLDRAQISKDFGGKDGLLEAVVDNGLPSVGNELDWMLEQTELSNELTTDEDVCLEDAVRTFALFNDAQIRNDERFVFQMALWATAANNSTYQAKLRELYKTFDELASISLQHAFEQILAEQPARAGLTVKELAIAATALVEGLAIRHAVDPESVSDQLTGSVLVALTESLMPNSKEDPGRIGDRLPAVDADTA